ncbi:RDD family protein [Tenacibaculum sp. nBUS_03]|uniref:RDD family protein n=1 Tax=Tenacibaculum sp. nBUS_03 TaxID=3395320 RepID=UPI003EBC9AD7
MKNIFKIIQRKISPYIGKVSFVMALLALTTTVISLYTKGSQTSYYIVSVFRYVDLQFFNFDFLEISGGTFSNSGSYNSYYRFNGLNISFNIILLVGSVFYMRSNKKDQSLLQFAHAVILFSSIISVLSVVVHQFNNFTLFKPIIFLFFILNITLLLFSYLVLSITETKYENVKKIKFKEFKDNQYPLATKYKRFLHLLLDSFLFMALTFNVFKLLPRVILYDMTKLLGDRLTLTILFVISAIAYYGFFETFFRRTPAKFLTNTFVLGTVKEKVRFDNIFMRSVSRKIPFNAFSFLWGTGWHDSISETTVVSLNDNKISKKYWLILPVLFLFFFANYQFNQFRLDYIRYKIENGKIESEALALDKKINNLQLYDFITLKNTYNNWGKSYFYKVIDVNGDNLTLAEIKKTYNERNLEEIDFLYESNPDKYKIHRVDKNYLRKGVCREYSFFNGFKGQGEVYIEGEKPMRIYAINNTFEPVLFFKSYYNRSDNAAEIEIENFGMACTLVSARVLEGGLKIKRSTSFPQKISKYNNDFEVYIEFNKERSPFGIELTFEDTVDINEKHRYVFKSDGAFKHSFIKVE